MSVVYAPTGHVLSRIHVTTEGHMDVRGLYYHLNQLQAQENKLLILAGKGVVEDSGSEGPQFLTCHDHPVCLSFLIPTQVNFPLFFFSVSFFLIRP